MKTVSILLSVLVLMYSSGLSEGWFDSKTVKITNDITPNTPVTVHCKSGNDDLGSHVLQMGQTYSFKFRNNFFPTTLFFCNFQWNSLGVNVSKWFNIYDAGKTTSDCDKCLWKLHRDGLCQWGNIKRGYECFPFNKDKSFASLRA